jgi:TatD DNase family protein
MPWADPHCHLYDERVGSLDGALLASREAGVLRLITVGCDLATTDAAIRDAAAGHATGFDVWATVGAHPHDAVHGTVFMTPLLDLAAELRVVAVGECGLDYFYDHSPREIQREVFAEQIRMAHHYDLPLVIHTREAWDDTYAVLRDEGVPTSTIFHCFTGGPTEAETCLALGPGVVLSFSGIVTFPSAQPLRNAAALTPLDRMTVETDSPYLAPIPFRGKANTPAYVPYVGAKIAEVKGVDPSEVEAATWATVARAYRLPIVSEC